MWPISTPSLNLFSWGPDYFKMRKPIASGSLSNKKTQDLFSLFILILRPYTPSYMNPY